MGPKFSIFVARCVVVVAALLFGTSSSWAATITVASTSGGTGGSDCTLRDAITAANTDAPVGACPAGSGADTIELPAGATITLTVVDNTGLGGDNGLPVITADLTIDGNGATIERSAAGGTPSFRVLAGGSCSLTLNALTITGGEAGSGGGIFFDGVELLTINECTISGNSAQQGGGLYICCKAGEAFLTNSTVSGNSAVAGGGLYIDSTEVMLRNCTVTDNQGGGIESFATAVDLANTIVANSASGGDCSLIGVGSVIDGGFNLVEDGSCGFPASGDPRLGPLANNGGPTPTHALMEGSIAIDAGDCSGGFVTTDQRGVSRPQRGGCDIGAFELGNPVPTVSEWGLIAMSLLVLSGGTVIVSKRRHGQAFAA